MISVKTITSKHQADFEKQMERFLNSIWGIDDGESILLNVEYSTATNGKDIYRSALIMYEKEK